MKLEKGKIILLEDDNEYFIVDKIVLQNKCYLYMCKLEPNNNNNLFFMEFIENKLFPVKDENTVKELLFIIAKKNLNKTTNKNK